MMTTTPTLAVRVLRAPRMPRTTVTFSIALGVLAVMTLAAVFALLRCYWFCKCSFFRWGRLLSGWFFRSCHHVLLGSICKEHFLSAVDTKRSMAMEKSPSP